MTRTIHFIIFIIFLACGFPAPIVAQTESSANTASNALAICPESIYLHTDREIYVAGENLFYKLYVNPDKAAGIAQISSIGYIVLRSQTMKVLSLIVKLKGGSSFGTIYIPDTLKSGMYELVAFTNYMKNYDEKNFYRKELLIINRFDKTLEYLYVRDSSGTSKKTANQFSSAMQIPASADFQIILEKDSFKIREKIKIGIQWNNPKIKNGIVNASLNIKAITPITVIPVQGSDIKKGSVDNEVFNRAVNSNPYSAEEKGVYIRGKISLPDNKPLKEECLFYFRYSCKSPIHFLQ